MSASNLLIVAHPDDETIFFGGTLLSLKGRGWKVIVVTDGNADGQGAARRLQLAEACKELGVKQFEQWEYPDIYENRIGTESLLERFKELGNPKTVFTHGIIGEYGHPHHQDVSWAVHSHFLKKNIPVWSVAYNSFATKTVRLTRKTYERKAAVFSRVYHSETIRFARVLPVHNQEGFHRTDWSEIDHLYAYFSDQSKSFDLSKLKNYRWFAPYLPEQKKVSQRRRF